MQHQIRDRVKLWAEAPQGTVGASLLHLSWLKYRTLSQTGAELVWVDFATSLAFKMIVKSVKIWWCFESEWFSWRGCRYQTHPDVACLPTHMRLNYTINVNVRSRLSSHSCWTEAGTEAGDRVCICSPSGPRTHHLLHKYTIKLCQIREVATAERVWEKDSTWCSINPLILSPTLTHAVA